MIVLPEYPRKVYDHAMRIVSWNVNGIRAIVRKQMFHSCLATYDPEVICLQETKAHPGQITRQFASIPLPILERGRQAGLCWHGDSLENCPSGRTPPYGCRASRPRRPRARGGVCRVFRGLCLCPQRQTRFEPPGRPPGLGRLLAYLRDLEQYKPVVCGGDFNVAHAALDLARPKENVRTHGFTLEERAGFQGFIDAGFVDAFRHTHREQPGQYTWWRQFGGARERNIGWRIDYMLISAACSLALVSAQDLIRGVWLRSLPCRHRTQSVEVIEPGHVMQTIL